MISVERVKNYAGLLGLLVLFFAPALRAQTVGTTTADFLKINDGAVPAAMGGCYTALGQDIYSISYNPAGLSYIRASQVAFMHLDSLASIQYEYFSFASGTNSNVFATNITFRHQPPIDNGNGNPPVNASDLAIQGGYAFKFSDSFRCGFTLKYIQSDLAGFSASTVAVDAGVVLDKLPYGLRAGLSIQNLGPGMNFDPNATPKQAPDPLPMFIRFGLGTHQVLDGGRDMNLAIEVFKPSDQDIKMGLGGEFWLFPQLFAIRAGYKIEGLGTPTYNVFQDYTLGCTLTRDFDGDDFSLDIAYDPADFSTTLEDTFFFGLNMKFNQLHLL